MSDDKFSFSYAAADLGGVAVEGRMRLNPLHSAVAHLLMQDAARHPLVELVCTNQSPNVKRIRVKVGVDRYSAEHVETLALQPGQTRTLALFPEFAPEKVAELNELTPTRVRFHLDDLTNGQILFETMLDLDLLAVNSAPLAARDPASNALLDQTRYFGAFVTPADPEIDAFLQQASAFLPPGENFGGYQNSVAAQVEAFYNALAAHGSRYVDSVLDFNPDPKVQVSQRVRLPRQALVMKAANCIDGTLLMASLLERVGIEPALAILPGHALVAWAPSKSSDRWNYLETTAIGQHSFAKACEIGKNFATGAAKAEEAGREGAFRLLPLRELRAAGIFPLPVTGDDSLRRIAQALEQGTASTRSAPDDAVAAGDPSAKPDSRTSLPAPTSTPTLRTPKVDVDTLKWSELQPLLRELANIFTEAELDQLLLMTFDTSLNHIAKPDNLENRVYTVVDWAKRRSSLGTLVAAAYAARPESQVLGSYMSDASDTVPGPSVDSQGAPVGPSTGESLSLVQRVRRDALQRRLDMLLEQHTKASDQLTATLEAANKPILQAQIRGIEEEMAQVEDELTQLLGA